MLGFPKKIIIMDAGLIYIHSDENFGTIIGKVKDLLSTLGKVYSISNYSGKFENYVINEKDLPSSIKTYDFILDYSTVWHKNYLIIKIESGIDNSFYLLIKEANKNSIFKNIICLTIILISLIIALFSNLGLLINLCFYLLSLCFFIKLILPSYKQKKQLQTIYSTIKQNF